MAKPPAIPETMKAVAIDRFGPPEVLQPHTMPVPKLSAGDVLIRVDTAGVGTWDAKIREGSWAERDTFPQILGTDGSGVVVSAGARVTRFQPGDRVIAFSYPGGGFYAEYVAVAAGNVALKPERLDMEEAGAVPIIGLTALQGVDDALGLGKGESVIIHGASGNVGMIAVQFAKLRGGRVLATASGKDGAKFVRRLGADAAVDGKTADILEAARELAPGGVDAVLAFAGGKQLTRCLDALRKGGRVAYPNGIQPEPRKRRGIKVIAYDGLPGRRQYERLDRAIEEARLEVPIAKSYPLHKAADAHRRVEKGHLLGKIVLRVW
jgi:NADPH:quinone reductase-like Zn-dependent oxidoreductase